MSTPENQSYLAAGINKLSPWGSRSPASKPTQGADGDITSLGLGLKQQRGGDHRITHRGGLSPRIYPRDCPPVVVRWFFAVDIPKRKPDLAGQPPRKTEKPRVAPKKYSAFSNHDSRAIEAAFQKLSSGEDATDKGKSANDGDLGHSHRQDQGYTGGDLGTARSAQAPGQTSESVKVPVNEDFLFDVDIGRRELGPAYWLGPVYDIRRGSWFHQDGSVQKPCDENMAMQLEEGYLKITPWRLPAPQRQRSSSQPRSLAPSSALSQDDVEKNKLPFSSPVTPKVSTPNLREAGRAQIKETSPEGKTVKVQEPSAANTYRLFGPYSNSVVTYQDANTAYILTDDFLSRMSSNMYQRFAGGSHLAGMKVVRGYVDPSKRVETKDDKGTRSSSKERPPENEDLASDKIRQTDITVEQNPNSQAELQSPVSESKRRNLERHMSSLVSSTAKEDREQQEEEVRKRDEKEIQNDYQDQEGDEQNREIEHLLLVTHGIGQRLGLRMETVNFIHDVNTLRKTLKAVYGESADLQALNSQVESLPKNCRLQVLPINWRHKLDFPKQSLKHNRKEHDLGDAGFGEEEDYPNLDDISVEGVPAVRNLITDLALDILLYQSPAYKDHISRIVVEECNRIYRLFMERNPDFTGKVSLVGHSLGSAIMFDILCAQNDDTAKRKGSTRTTKKTEHSTKLDFDVEDFYAIGSPIGLFQMLKGRTIAAKHSTLSQKPGDSETTSDPFLDAAVLTASSSSKLSDTMGTMNSEIPISAPKCSQIFNIFHPTDPISYRIEPLISPAMASLKPQPLPYTKRGIFGAPVGQGLTGIGTRVGQSVSGLWSSFSTGIASSLLNRSLGISAEDETKLRNQAAASSQSRMPLSLGGAANIVAGTIPGITSSGAAEAEAIGEEAKQKLVRDAIKAGEEGEHPPTLIDSELQTLYAGFQSRRKSNEEPRGLGETAEWAEAEERARKLKKEEAKVRALNSNGRVDYSIQEGAFDISLIAAVASHLSYWADEDVSHFMISQLLSRQRIVKRSGSPKSR